MYLNGLLIVDDRRKGHRVLQRDCRVAVDELDEKPAAGLEAEAERQNVEEDDILDVAGQNTALDRGTHRHDLIGIYLGRRLFAEDLFDGAGDDRRTGLAADEYHLVDIFGLELGVPERLLAGLDRALDEI